MINGNASAYISDLLTPTLWNVLLKVARQKVERACKSESTCWLHSNNKNYEELAI